MKHLRFRSSTLLILLALFAFAITGCRSKKNLLNNAEKQLDNKSADNVISDVLKSELKYTTLSTKGSIEVQRGNSGQKVTTVFRIQKDSVIQASIQPILGIEVVRISFTKDSIIILDRLKKRYVAERFKDSSFAQDIDFNFYNLQAMLTNQLFLPGGKQLQDRDYKKFDVSTLDNTYLIKTRDKNDIYYDFSVNAHDNLVSTYIYNKKANLELQWSYNEFIIDGRYVYPTLMNAEINALKNRFDVIISYTKLDIDKKLNIDYAIPNSYTKISFKDFLSAYMK